MTDTTADAGTDTARQEPATPASEPGSGTADAVPSDPPNGPETSTLTASDTDPDTSDSTDSSPNAEAARYRIRAREAEQRADQLATQLEALQRAKIDDLIRDRVQKMGLDWDPALMWEAGLTTEMVRAEDGTIDAAKVRTAVDNATEKFGLRPRVGYGVDHSRTQADPMENVRLDPLAEALAPKRR